MNFERTNNLVPDVTESKMKTNEEDSTALIDESPDYSSSKQLLSFLGKENFNFDFLSSEAREGRNKNREYNFNLLTEKRKSSRNELLVGYKTDEEVVNSFWQSERSESLKQKKDRLTTKLRMKMRGIKNPQNLLNLLADNPSIYSYYEIDMKPRDKIIKSFHYDRLSPGFIQFLSDLDNVELTLERLNALKINLEPFSVDLLKDKATSFFNILANLPQKHFQKVVQDLSEFTWLQGVNVFNHEFNDKKNLSKDFLSILEVVERGGFSNEEKDILERIENYGHLSTSITSSIKLADILHNKDFLNNLHVVLTEQLLTKSDTYIDNRDFYRAQILERKGALSKLSKLLSNGLIFKSNNINSGNKSYLTESVLKQINVKDLDAEHDEELTAVLEVVNMAYEHLLDPDFVMMRAFLGVFTVEDTPLVHEGLELVRRILSLVDSFSPIEMRKVVRYLKEGVLHEDFSSLNFIIAEFEKYQDKVRLVSDKPQSIKIESLLVTAIENHENYLSGDLDLVVKEYVQEKRIKKREDQPTDEDQLTDIEKRIRERERVEKRTNGISLASIDTFSIDKEHIIDQSLDVIHIDENHVRLQFYVTEKRANELKQLFEEESSEKLVNGSLKYGNQQMIDCFIYTVHEGMRLFIPRIMQKRALIGLINIEIDLGALGDNKSFDIDELNAVITFISGGKSDESVLDSPDEESNRHLFETLLELNTKSAKAEVENFRREKVLGDYETMVIPGRHEKLKEQYGSFVSYHGLHSYNNIAPLLRTGLLSSHERYRREAIISGLSTWKDFETGGANSVFLRTFSEHTLTTDSEEKGSGLRGDIVLLISPKVWDRTDFYIYNYDEYGATSEACLETRYSPEEYLKFLSDGHFNWANEQMFKRGISKEMILGILVRSQEDKIELIEKLVKEGVPEVNGRPVADFIFVRDIETGGYGAALDIVDGLPIGTTYSRVKRQHDDALRQNILPEKMANDIDEKENLEGEKNQEAGNGDKLTISDLLKPEVSVAQMIEMLSKDNLYLKDQFEHSAHVSEGYSIGEHTQMVGNQYNKYFEGRHSQQLFSYPEMKLALTLHDIGKHQAFENDGSTKNQHLFTKKIAGDVISSLGIESSKAELLVDIIAQDFIGTYLQSPDQVTLEKSTKGIIEISQRNKVSAKAVLELMKVYYMSDASSYTKDATGKEGFLDSIKLFEFNNGELKIGEKYSPHLVTLENNIIESVQ